ncbi:hypothetical protein QFC21_000943 [Naganishia friedmannii]|uniref:Uncharacterized protein n=1 Tax=Naganishia friedmannii TaxID=89922 RepID=A0ACC2W8F4_9TREE|nr:hypothetical protein QFC21_000943 [Naganishia friedmannii]
METSAAPALPSLLLETYHELHPDRPPPDLFNKQSTEYLTRLTGYSLNSLTSEPSRIADEHDFVGRELTSLCIGEYKSFVAVHQCEEQVRGVLDDFDASLEELRKAIPELERECATFIQETSGIQADRRRAQIVLEHQDKLVDLLDIPQLVDTCVRNGYYHEAMELTAHTRQLVLRHPDVALVHSISAQVTSIMQLQLSQLVASLREPVKLPVLVKSIGFLRKMGSLEEDELRLAFLESRAQCWRDHVKEHVDKERHEPTRYVRRYVDAFRELQYDTVSQYTAIFLDPSTFRLHNHISNGNTVTLDIASRAQAVDLLVRYAHQAISDLLQCITMHVPSITDPSSLASLLTQLGYTALSFARVGMDFSAHLPEVFENAIQQLTTSGWHNAVSSVVDRLKPPSSAIRTGSPSGRSDIDSVLAPGFLISAELLATLTRSGAQAYTPPVHGPSSSKTVPPLYLTSYPLLATYTNSTLVTLNSLRLLAPVALFPRLYSNLLDNLTEFAQALLSYANNVTGQGDTAYLPPARRRPEGLRRNTSISNRDQLAERTQAQERDGRRVLSTVLDAYVNGCVGFLKAALVEGVYHSRFGSVQDIDSGKQTTVEVHQSNRKLSETVDELKRWVEKHAELPAEREKVSPEGIEEEETANEIAPPTNDSAIGTIVDRARQKDAIEMSTDSTRNGNLAAKPKLRSSSPVVADGPTAEYNLEADIQTMPEIVDSEAGLAALSAGATTAEAAQHPAPVDAGQIEPIEQVDDASDVHNAASMEPESRMTVTEPPEVPSTRERNVVEQVLEVAVKFPEVAEVAEGVAEGTEGVSVQVMGELQIPSVSADSTNLDDAKPVPIVPDTSVHHESAGRDILTATGSSNKNDTTDMLDELIKAKQVAEAMASEKDSHEQHSDVDANPTDVSAKPMPDDDVPAHDDAPSITSDTTTPVASLDMTVSTDVPPPANGPQSEQHSTNSQNQTVPTQDQDHARTRNELPNGNGAHTAMEESSVTIERQPTQPQQKEQGSAAAEPETAPTLAAASSEKLNVVRYEPPAPAEIVEPVTESSIAQVEDCEEDVGEGNDSSPPTPHEPATPGDESKVEASFLKSVANGKSKKKNKKKGKK